MVPEKYRLESIGRFLLAAFERQRPGFTAWTPEVEYELLVESEAELAQMEVQCRELGVDDPGYWKKARALLSSVLIPRYAALAKEELALAKSGYHLWRGGDLIARGAFAVAGLLLGAAAVEIPWIPIEAKWVPWAMFIAGPLLPDAQLWFFNKRYQRRLNALVRDLANAGKSIEAYRSIAEMQQALGDPTPVAQPELKIVAEAPPLEEKREGLARPEDPSRLKH